MFRKMVIDSIKTDPDWNNGEYGRKQPRGLISAHVYVFHPIAMAERSARPRERRLLSGQTRGDFLKLDGCERPPISI